MILPILGMKSNFKSTCISLLGINKGENSGFAKAINMVGCGTARVRKSRKPVMFLDEEPSQIITCGERLFFRYNNRLVEIFAKENGELYKDDHIYYLLEFEKDRDRKLFEWDNNIYVLPDGIILTKENENWNSFGLGCSVSAAMPFINNRTLFYTSGYSGEEVCNDSAILKVGIKVRFSWLPNDEFTIVAVDEANSFSADGAVIFEGSRITLDRAVEGYNNLKSNHYMQYAFIRGSKVLKNMHIGCNSGVNFSDKSINFYDSAVSYTFDYKPKEYFKEGQTVSISGSSIAQNNITAKIEKILDNSLVFDKDFINVNEKVGTEIIISPVIPDFDFATVIEDRLFGIDNKGGKLWVSALKNLFLFYDKPENKEDSWSVNLTETATGITVWRDNIICYTKSGGFRVLGYHALNFGLRQLPVSGIKIGSEQTLGRIGDMLFYNSNRGVMRYSGGRDVKISDKIGDLAKAKKGIALGKEYYLLTDDKIYVYDPDSEIWWCEDANGVSNVFCAYDNRYLLIDKVIYVADGGKFAVDWETETTEILPKDKDFLYPHSCKIKLANNGIGFMRLYFGGSGDDFKLIGTTDLADKNIIEFKLPGKRCCGFKIKLEGSGYAEIENIRIIYR